MAIRDEIREQRQSIKGQGVKAHLSYFWEYYKFPTLAVIAVVAFVTYVAYSMITTKDIIFTSYFINAQDDIDSTKEAALQEAFSQRISYDVDKETPEIDFSLSHKPGDDTSAEALAFSTRLSVAVQNGDLDCAVMDADNFDEYVDLEAFTDLRNVFSEEEIASYDAEGLVHYYQGNPVGIDITDATWVKMHQLYPEDTDVIYGFGMHHEDYGNAKILLDLLFEE